MSEGAVDITFFREYFKANPAARQIIRAMAKSGLSMVRIIGEEDKMPLDRRYEYVQVGDRAENLLPYLAKLEQMRIIGRVQIDRVNPRWYLMGERVGDIPKMNKDYRKTLVEFLDNLSK